MRVAIVALLLLAAFATTPVATGGAGGTGTFDDTGSPDIVRTATLSLTPDRPGTVHADLRYALPDGLHSLSITPGPGLTVLDAHGFTRDGTAYTWDGHTANPSLSVREQVNQSYSGRAATDTRQGYSFVATPRWAIAPVPTMQTSWTWVGSGHVSLTRRAHVDGEGATGGEIAYLGPYTAYNATGGGQQFRLVVPADANPVEQPRTILASLVDASKRIRVGARDASVFFVAAPADVTWGPAGLEYGGSDAWVEADQSLDSPGDTWTHEYVHTRQAYEPTTATRWTLEATAVYEAALVDLEAGRISFAQFHDTLAQGTNRQWQDAVLSNPGTWGSALVPYEKGAVTVATLDYRIRSSNSGSYADVLARLNDLQGKVTQSAFLDAVSAASTDSVRSSARQWTETTDTPDMWTRRQYDQAFATRPSEISASFGDSAFHVTGETRNRTYAAPPTLVTGESLSATVTLNNTGGQPGPYTVSLDGSNETLEQRTGTLAPGETENVTLRHTFDQPGTYAIDAGFRTVTVTVLPPATPQVSGVTVTPSNVTAGGTVTVSVSASNPADRPATGSIPVTLDGHQAGTVPVALPPGGSTTQSLAVTLPDSGTHAVSAGGHQQSVTVTPRARTAIGTPGLGVLPAAFALLALAIVAARRRT